MPGQVFDVDPSRSDNLYRVNSEVSGSGPRVFDAGVVPGCHLFLLEVYRPFEDWTTLGRTGGEFASFNFADLGLDPAKEHFVFEFWTKKLLGSFAGSFPPGPIDPRYRSQVFCIREKKTGPQVLATSRHITCGGVDLVDVNWKKGELSGRSQIIRDDPYTIYVSLPNGYRLEKFDCPDAHMIGVEKDGILLKIALQCPESRCISWSIRLTRRPAGPGR